MFACVPVVCEICAQRLRLVILPTTTTSEATLNFAIFEINDRFFATLGHFTCWISLSLRPQTESKPLSFGLSWS